MRPDRTRGPGRAAEYIGTRPPSAFPPAVTARRCGHGQRGDDVNHPWQGRRGACGARRSGAPAPLPNQTPIRVDPSHTAACTRCASRTCCRHGRDALLGLKLANCRSHAGLTTGPRPAYPVHAPSRLRRPVGQRRIAPPPAQAWGATNVAVSPGLAPSLYLACARVVHVTLSRGVPNLSCTRVFTCDFVRARARRRAAVCVRAPCVLMRLSLAVSWARAVLVR